MSNDLLRHCISSIHYRFVKAVNDVPQNYWNIEMGNGIRTPANIIKHMIEVMEYADNYIKSSNESTSPQFLENDLDQLKWLFIQVLKKADQSLLQFPITESQMKILIQGPLSDVLTHIGQLALIRRAAGSPLPKENFMKAEIRTGLDN